MEKPRDVILSLDKESAELIDGFIAACNRLCDALEHLRPDSIKFNTENPIQIQTGWFDENSNE